jgi:mRNA interferase YafQ
MVLDILAEDLILPERFHDHALSGSWAGYKDCHIQPDMVLIYRTIALDTLEVVRLGSHSELKL